MIPDIASYCEKSWKDNISNFWHSVSLNFFNLQLYTYLFKYPIRFKRNGRRRQTPWLTFNVLWHPSWVETTLLEKPNVYLHILVYIKISQHTLGYKCLHKKWATCCVQVNWWVSFWLTYWLLSKRSDCVRGKRAWGA